MNTIGIIGQGFVGTAIHKGLENFYKIAAYDIDEAKSNTTLEKLIIESNIIFQCLPTPMKKSGACDLSIVNLSLRNINMICEKWDRSPIVIVKSTVPPGTCEALNNVYENINIVFSPEFLTEANSIEDFKNQSRIILGGPRPYTTQVKTMFRKAFPHIPIIKTGYKTAEMVKYFINNFLSTKVSFANEMYEVCKEFGIDYDKVTEYALYDGRIGKSHLAVPGPDGDYGFGGHCFPKDLDAMIHFALQNNVEPLMLKSTKQKNDMVRKNRDWEKMLGRAISSEEE
jgi:nucleotide sugar dehydrogenase